jgi:CubicO group peptidase (beta-lactamase class C family)
VASCRIEEDSGSTLTDDINSIVEAELARQNVLGGAVAVVKNGSIIHSQGYGFTSPAMTVRVTDSQRFSWASISKPLTAIALLQLDESSSEFSINDNASEHVDHWYTARTDNRSDITVKQLLSHRSGLIHYDDTDNCPDNATPRFDRTRHTISGRFNSRDAVSVFEDQGLCFNPGARFKYSTFGYSLAAAALEGASGQNYATWVADNIALPLGIDSLNQKTYITNGYRGTCGEDGGWIRVREPSKSFVLPGGGWASDIQDLARFANGILENSLISNSQRLWTTSTGNSNEFRLGISLSSDGRRAWQNGVHDDLRTFMHLYHGYSDRVGVVVYLNNPSGDPERVAKLVATEVGVHDWGLSPTDECK